MQRNNNSFENTPLFTNLRRLINLMDELSDIGLHQEIKLPKIATLGTQSSGKSSVMESIVGIDFLPRGNGVVTRRPLELRLVHTMNADKPWAVFKEIKGQKFYDFNVVRTKIQQLTDKVAGSNKGIVDKPIVLNIFSKDVPDLTLVDLPGITRIAMENTAQAGLNMEKITKDMAARYIKDERCIILCVVPANQDMSTSDGLHMAKTFDKTGKRTIGVITKIDIMDRGTNAKRMIMNEVIKLKLGYVGVKNRSQQDINDGVTVMRGLEQERIYFSQHPIYSTIPQGFIGSSVLTKKLSKILFYQIKHYLPAIMKEIKGKINDCKQRLDDLGRPLPVENAGKMQLMWSMISTYTTAFENSIKGKFERRKHLTNFRGGKSGGTRIRQIFNRIYLKEAKQGYRASKRYSDRQIEKAIYQHEGDTIPGFIAFDAFIFLISPLLDELEDPAMDCLNEAYLNLEEISSQFIQRVFTRFPSLAAEVQDIASQVIQEERDKTRVIVQNIIDAERGYLFTNDYGYIRERTSIIPKSKKNKNNGQMQNNPQPKPKPIDQSTILLNEMRARIDTYFNIVLRNIRDGIPKAIGYFLVKKTQENMPFQLQTRLNRNQKVLDLLGEPKHVAEERKTVMDTLNLLQNSLNVMKKDPDLARSLRQQEDYAEQQREKQLKKKLKKREQQKNQQRQQEQAPQKAPKKNNNLFA